MAACQLLMMVLAIILLSTGSYRGGRARETPIMMVDMPEAKASASASSTTVVNNNFSMPPPEALPWQYPTKHAPPRSPQPSGSQAALLGGGASFASPGADSPGYDYSFGAGVPPAEAVSLPPTPAPAVTNKAPAYHFQAPGFAAAQELDDFAAGDKAIAGFEELEKEVETFVASPVLPEDAEKAPAAGDSEDAPGAGSAASPPWAITAGGAATLGGGRPDPAVAFGAAGSPPATDDSMYPWQYYRPPAME